MTGAVYVSHVEEIRNECKILVETSGRIRPLKELTVKYNDIKWLLKEMEHEGVWTGLNCFRVGDQRWAHSDTEMNCRLLQKAGKF
jgi:hypothetical protein